MSQEIWQFQNDITYLTLPTWEEKGARIIFTSRHTGHSQGAYMSLNMALHVGDYPEAVLANRKKVLQLMGTDLSHMVCCQQVHSNQVAVVDSSYAGRGSQHYEDALPSTDGLVTATPGLVLATFYADCIPVFLFDPVRKVAALCHSGWKGTMGLITTKTLEVMSSQFNCQPADIMVYIGPGISSCCFEIQADLADKVLSAFAADDDIIISKQKRIRWDLKETIRRCVINFGVPESQIIVSSWCTSCHTDYFYSFRKEQGITGRMAALIILAGGKSNEEP
ncbi:MAG TPA: peptidoglycan editing factor PgeF [Syntrophomonadaceae bacterium]|nr:peptidoglycan editing factor PgeF [Syntrophomonadaceae bacterium]HQE22558.1 peptidoglycan editing factor PgeF [Syntrophomonadaceae bacterium]